ncbi:hypothetical protein [Chitinophaga filiformis]|uniref:Uncharacterized protein n=1 Tax=Chitinophaga filiformis TaxID=104663 RepID=A0A1G7LT99_CHIFI|nr:hypothetical protein [Chitinophaga filiformis]SDF52768.1 hypothetical protein SAMN04488121_102181 [Chitinophaga filiformis]
MPRQNSIIPLSGRMADLVYYYRKDKRGRKNYYVRRAPEDVHQTAATKKTASDFGTASKASRLIRQALKPYTCKYKDESLHYRLNTVLADILRKDTARPAGEKRLLPENMSALTGFRFNSETRVPKMDYVNIEKDEMLRVKIPGTNKDMTAKLIALSIDFEKEKVDLRVTEAMTIKETTTITLERSNNLTILLLEVHQALDIIGVLEPAPIPPQTRVRPILQVQPKSISKPSLLHPYAYPKPGKRRHITGRLTRQRSPFPILSAPPSPLNGLSPSNRGR